MIPNYEHFMLPFLQILGDGKEHTRNEMKELLAMHFNLTESEVNETFASGRPVLGNRVGWSRTYLKMAGLIEYTKRGVFKITAKGKKVLSQNVDKIDINYLKQFPEFLDFLKGNSKENENIELTNKPLIDTVTSDFYTPEETFEKSFQQIKQSRTRDSIKT